MPTYTYANLEDDTQRDANAVTNIRRILNRAAIEVISTIDLRSTKRKTESSPVLHEEQFDYQAPTDLKDWALIDIRRAEGRNRSDKFNMVTSDYFDRYKDLNRNIVTIEDADFLKKLRVSSDLRGDDGTQAVVHDCESLTADGTWSVSLDASNLTLDEDVFLHGDASLNFDMDQAGTSTTAGYIQNSTFGPVDLSGYEDGQVYAYVYAPTVSGLDGFTLRIGSSSSDYLSLQVTTTNENLAFHTGWMLLRWDLKDATETGTVDLSAIDYVRIAIDKGNDSMQDTDFRLDYIVARRGIYHTVYYYSKYPWQNTSGTYLENSTADTDKLNADTEEYNLIVMKGKQLIAEDQSELDEAAFYAERYEQLKENYEMKYPTERLMIIQDYHDFSDDPQEEWLNN